MGPLFLAEVKFWWRQNRLKCFCHGNKGFSETSLLTGPSWSALFRLLRRSCLWITPTQLRRLRLMHRPCLQRHAQLRHHVGIFSRVIRRNKVDVTFQKAVTTMWAKAISKWQLLFEASPSTAMAKQLESMEQEARMTSLRDMFGSKSPHTVEKRAASRCDSISGCNPRHFSMNR